jgi:hypothetical protein
MSKHTPGPWKVVDGHYPSFKNVTGPSFTISVVMWATDLTEADYQKRNADLHLIAAAPELLAALQLAVRQNGHDMLMTGEELRKCEAAIAKAKGEQS